MKTSLTRIAMLALSVLLIAQFALAQQQPSPVQGTLVIPDTKVLPGVPFDMWIELRNTSDAAITVALNPHLIVRPEGGEPFEARTNGELPVLFPQPNSDLAETYVTLTPRENKTLTVPILDGLRGPYFFADPRLSPPGRYGIAMRLDSFENYGLGERPPATYAGPVLTNEVTVDRIEPTGADAKLWQRMQEWTNGKWASTYWAGNTVLFNEVFTKYPDSSYVPYAVLGGGGGGDRYPQLLLDTIKKFPGSPVIELLHLEASRRVGHFALPNGDALEAAEAAKVQQSKRPTTRILAFGREDVPRPAPCPHIIECEDEP